MRNTLRYIQFLIIFLLPLQVFAGEVLLSDSAKLAVTDSIFVEKKLQELPDSSYNVVKKPFKPDADKAVWFAAVVPGLGQIYNRQYWKLPIIYGGAMGLVYAISWNNQMYVDYRKGYVDIIDGDPDSRAYESLLPAGVVIDSSNKDYYTRVIKSKQDTYQRYRDLSIVCAGVLYLLTIIDAYVDAQLHDYDIGPDLTFKIAPAVLPPSINHETETAFGVRCKMKF